MKKISIVVAIPLASRLVSRVMVTPLLLTGIVLSAGRAHANEAPVNDPPTAAVSRLSEEGIALFKARDYRHASEKFVSAYALDQDPNLLFNIARCYEALGDSDGAIEKYESFLAKPDTDAQGKRRAAEAIRVLRQSKPASAPSSAAAGASSASEMRPREADLAAAGRGRPGGTTGQERGAQLSGEGLALYKAHDYNRAAEKFLQAYAVDADPNLLFNIARCYAALGDSGAAIEKYDAYLKAPGTDAKGREQADRAVRALRDQKAEPKAPVVAKFADSTRTPDEVNHGSNKKAVIGWVVTGILTAGAAVTGLLALDSAGKLRTARQTFPGDGPDIARQASRTTALTLSADGLAIAAAVMGGVSLYWTLGNSSSSSTELRAAIGPGGVRLAGSF